MRYTKDGQTFVKVGGHIFADNKHNYFVTENWLLNHGYYPYKIVEGTGTDGVVNGEYIHYVEPVNIEEDEPTD